MLLVLKDYNIIWGLIESLRRGLHADTFLFPDCHPRAGGKPVVKDKTKDEDRFPPEFTLGLIGDANDREDKNCYIVINEKGIGTIDFEDY